LNFLRSRFNPLQCSDEVFFNGIHVLKHTVAEELLSQFIPEMFHRIHFGAVGWLDDHADVGWNGQCVCTSPMTGSTIHDEENVLIRVTLGERIEKDLQGGCIHIRQNEGVNLSGKWSNSCIGIRVFSNCLLRNNRPAPCRCPARCGSRDATEASFIFKANRESELLYICNPLTELSV